MSIRYARLYIPWTTMACNDALPYKGTRDGLKNNVTRANKTHKPKQFVWFRNDKNELFVKRIV